MNVTINGKQEEIPLTRPTVTELLTQQKVEMPEMVSVELNGAILRRTDYDTTIVNEQDQLEFLYFMGGGRIPTQPTERRHVK